MKKILLYGHGGAYNHGAEAILRSSVSIFRRMGCPVLLSTHFPDQDKEFGLDKLVDRLIPADFAQVHIPDQTCQLHGEFPPGGRRKPATPPEGSASNGLCQP